MRFLLTLIAGLLAPSLFAANLSFLAPTNNVLPTNLGKFRASNIVAAVNLGVGIDSPQEALHVASNILANGTKVVLSHTNNDGSVPQFRIESNSGGNYKTSLWSTAAISSTAPGQSFQVGTPAGAWTFDGSTAALTPPDITTDLGSISSPISNIIASAGSVLVLNGGRVGIGTNAPAAALHVNGDVKIEGAITTANGTLLSNMTDTWTNAGTTYNAIRMNVIETASAADSRLLMLEINTNGMYQFMRDKKFFIYNTNTDATTFERGGMWWSNNVFRVGTEKGSVGGTARDVYIMTPQRQWTFSDASAVLNCPGAVALGASSSLSWVGGSQLYGGFVNGEIRMVNAAGTDFGRLDWGGATAAYPGILKTNGHLAVCDGTGNWLTPTNGLFFPGTIDTTATTTTNIHQECGRVRLAAGQQTYTVTNNNVTASSVVIGTVSTDDATLLTVKAIPGAGFITLKGNAAATADTDISWWLPKR